MKKKRRDLGKGGNKARFPSYNVRASATSLKAKVRPHLSNNWAFSPQNVKLKKDLFQPSI